MREMGIMRSVWGEGSSVGNEAFCVDTVKNKIVL